MEAKEKILIVEDEVLIAKHIEDILVSEGYSIAGIAHDGITALEYVKKFNPDLCLFDINIEGDLDGIQVATIVKKETNIPFMFLTALSDLATLERAKVLNPCGYVVKPFKTRDLISSITIGLYNYNLRKKNKVIDLELVNKIALSDLTQKEFEILMDISQGFTNAQVAKKNFISLSTVKYHTQNIYSKLDVKNRTSAIKKVMELA